jgi:aspartate/methionine/tyrosine aminotransferase
MGTKTNFQMYEEIVSMYEKGAELDYAAINKVFNLEGRSVIELRNLQSYIICHTLMCGQDILKAQLEKDKKREQTEIANYTKRCNLMTILIKAADSVIFTESKTCSPRTSKI